MNPGWLSPNSALRSSNNWNQLTLAGPDIQGLLHRLSTLNVESLPTGQGHYGFFLTALGRIQSHFVLWKISPTEFRVEFPDDDSKIWKSRFLTHLEGFTFSEQYEILDNSDQNNSSCRWVFLKQPFGFGGDLAIAPGHIRILPNGVQIAAQTYPVESGIFYSLWGSELELEHLIHEQLPDLSPWNWSDFENYRIAMGIPWIQDEVTPERNPLELALGDGVSFNKGCYPGQEVIERIRSQGSPAKRLVSGKLNHSERRLKVIPKSQAVVGQVILSSEGQEFEIEKIIQH